jgi:tRNA-2-methylthio-N6-dimethylallyladenosine synthase
MWQNRTKMNFTIKTFGCQMNVSDSEKIRYLLKGKGWAEADNEAGAEVVIINSCAVREKAQEKIFSYIGRIPVGKVIIVAGCVAQSEKENILKRSPRVNFVLGTHQFFRVGSIIDSLVQNKAKDVQTGFTEDWKEVCPDRFSRESPVTGFISIMEGCNNFCHYCIVPFTRGREKYRPLVKIVKEARYLSEMGYREIILLGQNVNNWEDGSKKMKFSGLLKVLAEETDVRWIRFITSYPGYFDDELIEVMVRHPRIARHLHFPAQSGSTRILKMMNRKYSRGEYLDITGRFRKTIPEIKFSSDFIVGFPGETEHDFELTLSLMRRVQYESVFSFVYSPRKHTRSFRSEDNVDREVKKDRLHRLQTVQESIQLANNQNLIGQVLEVLITGKNYRKPGEVIGRTESYRVVNFASVASEGEFKKVLIQNAGPHSLRGKEYRE